MLAVCVRIKAHLLIRF